MRWLAAGYKALFRVSHAEQHRQSLEWHCEIIAVVRLPFYLLFLLLLSSPLPPPLPVLVVFVIRAWGHGLSQQGVWVPFWTPKPLKRTPQDTQIVLCGISKNLNLLIIHMTLLNDIMSYFDEFIHVYGWNMRILWSPLNIWTPNIFTILGTQLLKSWLRHCLGQWRLHGPKNGEMHCL